MLEFSKIFIAKAFELVNKKNNMFIILIIINVYSIEIVNLILD